MSDSVQPHSRQPTRLPRPWDSPGKNTGVGCHLLLQCMNVKSLSRVQLLATPWTTDHHNKAPISVNLVTYILFVFPVHVKVMFTLSYDNGTPLQYFCLENPMDGGAWKAAVHGVAKGRTWLSDFTFTFHFHALEKEMATHSSVLAWRIPGTAEPGRLPSMGSHRVGHDWSNLAAAAAADFILISCYRIWGSTCLMTLPPFPLFPYFFINYIVPP